MNPHAHDERRISVHDQEVYADLRRHHDQETYTSDGPVMLNIVAADPFPVLGWAKKINDA